MKSLEDKMLGSFWKPLQLMKTKEWGEQVAVNKTVKQVQAEGTELKSNIDSLAAEIECLKAQQAIRRGK